MTKYNKTKNAFTLAEVVVVFTIIAVVVVARMGIVKSRYAYATRYQYYSAYMNLKQMVGNLMADGYTTTSAPTTYIKGVPNVWNRDVSDATHSVGMCQRLLKFVNTIPFVNPSGNTVLDDCTASVSSATTDFSSTSVSPNFVTTNGMRYYISNDSLVPPYSIYIDINGLKGDGVKNKDVMAFTVTSDGIVRPDAASLGATNTNYLSASYRYWDNVNNKYVTPKDGNGIPKVGLSYQQAVCEAGDPVASVSPAYNCGSFPTVTDCTTNVCEVVITPPGL